MSKKKLLSNLTVAIFLSVPILSSIISSIHLVELFSLGNTIWESLTLAVAFEMGAITSFMIIPILEKINKKLAWADFFLLSSIQIFGNIFFSFDFISDMMLVQPDWLRTFSELIGFLGVSDVATFKIIAALVLGLPIPLVSLFSMKSLIDYVRPTEPPKEQEIDEDQQNLNLIKERISNAKKI